MERTPEEIKEYQKQLGRVLNRLEQTVQAEQQKIRLGAIREGYLAAARTPRALNEVRAMLLEGFTVYAEGPGFFGKKMEPLEAGAGSYEVEIEIKEAKAQTNSARTGRPDEALSQV